MKRILNSSQENETLCKFKEFTLIYKKFLSLILVAKKVNDDALSLVVTVHGESDPTRLAAGALR